MKELKEFVVFFLDLMIRIAAAAVVGVLLLTVMYMVPADWAEKNLASSAYVFGNEEGNNPIFDWCTSATDNYTDAIILLTAANDSDESPLTRAMSGKSQQMFDLDPFVGIVAHYVDGRPFDYELEYYRYWHGYVLYVKPMLSVTGYWGIRILNLGIQIAMAVTLVFLMIRRNLKRYIFPYLLSYGCIMPIAVAYCLQYSSCYYILSIGSMVVIALGDKMNKKDAVVFLYIGIATAFFDFLTYPIATLGVPAVFYYCMRKRCDVFEDFFCGVKICFSWCIGYLGMWASKWVLASIITGKNVMADAASAVEIRTGLASADTKVWQQMMQAVNENVASFTYTPVMNVVGVVVVVLLAILTVRIIKSKCRKKLIMDVLFTMFPFVVLFLLPIAWYMVTANHSLVHDFFTNKALVVSAFAGMCALVKACDKCCGSGIEQLKCAIYSKSRF